MFTHTTKPPGSNGGLLNAIVGTLIQTGIGTLIGTPIGLMVGTYLAEYGRSSALANAVRFVSDVLLSAPSILIGLFVYELAVEPFGGFSGIAGCLALAVLVIPIVVRTTEDMLQLIPPALREAAMALGAPKWRVIVLICYRAAKDGIVTGILLAIARIAGETAPLLFTSLGNLNWSISLGPANGEPAGDHLSIRRLRLRRLGAARLGRRVADHRGRAGPQHRCAVRVAWQELIGMSTTMSDQQEQRRPRRAAPNPRRPTRRIDRSSPAGWPSARPD